MIKVIDTHAHYDDEAFDCDRDEILTNMLENSVDSIINIGCSIESSLFTVNMTEKYERVYGAVGIHPANCENLPIDYTDQLEKMTENKKIVAIGEIGLDYHYDGYIREHQIDCFKKQLELAKKLNLPVIIHSRDATKDTLDILKEYKPKGVVHCFSGSSETAQEIVKLGMMISFTGVLTFKNSKKAVEACASIPIERIMLETDCPYMAPIPHRGERNNSSYVVHTAEKLAEIKDISVEDAIRICNNNAIEFFGLKR